MTEINSTEMRGGFLSRLFFYFVYGWRNIQRGGRWTSLAIFCIAAGVASVVALRGLGLSISESLINSVRTDNKGDLLIQRESNNGPDFALLMGGGETSFFTETELQSILSFAEENNAQAALFTTGGAVQIAGESGGIINISQFVTTYLVDPQSYPPLGNIRVIEPAGANFADLFTGGNDIVISENMAEAQFLSVGDTVRVARTEELFTVRGIVGTEAEAGFSNIFAAFFGFAYFDIDTVRNVIDPEIGYNRVGIALPEAISLPEAEALVQKFWDETSVARRQTDVDAAADELQDRQEIATVLGDFIVVMGLGALLIGGVGIMNTMLVLVRRRTNEVAALKTFGLKGGQVASLFLAENILLGVIGSAIGCVVGVLLGGLVNQYGEQFIQQDLPWRIYPEALLYGISLGMVTTVIFGLVPLMTALRIRPAIILRPNEAKMAGLGVLQSIGLTLLIVVLLGLIVGQIVQPTFGLVSSFSSQDAYVYSIIGVAVTLLILAILTALLWIVVWFVGKLPSFGNVELRLALRNMSSQRWRTATTLLALSAGMFALSSISFVGEGTRQLLNDLVGQSFGGNVLAFPFLPGGNQTLNNIVELSYDNALSDVEGVTSRTIIGTYNTELEDVDGQEVNANADEVDPFNPDTIAPFAWMNLSEWDTTNPEVYTDLFNIVAGRNLTLEDRGQRVLIGPADSAALLGIEVGSQISYRAGRQSITFEVIGLYGGSGGAFGSSGGAFGSGGPVIAPDALSGLASPIFQIFTFQVEEEFVAKAVTELSAISIPPTIAINVGFIDSLLQRFILQFAAIPTIVGLLSLLAAAVIMANTVALGTLERQRQIGILKAVGLKSGRVLRIMLIESSIVGLLSAVIGLGLSSLAISLFTSFSGTAIPLPRESVGVAIALIVASVVIAWISTFLSANVAVRERVMNVLRYE